MNTSLFNAFPPTGGVQERKSLDFYIGRAKQSPPEPDLLLNIWREMREEYCLKFYGPHKSTEGTIIMKDGVPMVDPNFFQDLVDSVNKSASPGVDLCYQFQTNRSYLEYGSKFEYDLNDRLKSKINWYDAGMPEYSPEEMIRRNITDPIRLFCKNEAQKKNKETRLINSVSVLESGCSRLKSMKRTMEFVDKWTDGVSSVGIRLKDIHAVKEFRRRVAERLGLDIESSDVRGFEYCFAVACHFMAMDIEYYQETGTFPDLRPARSVVEKLIVLEAVLETMKKIYVCSDGYVLECDFSWMNSGKFTTAFYDTHVRSALCSVVATLNIRDREDRGVEINCPPNWCVSKPKRTDFPDTFHALSTGPRRTIVLVPAVSNGDDCLNSAGFDCSSEYRRIGFVITDRVVASDNDPWPFCSHLIYGETHFPESLAKTLLQLLRNKTVTTELWDAFVYVNESRPDWPRISEFVLNLISTVDGAR